MQLNAGVPQGQFNNALASANNTFRMPPWTDAVGNPTSRLLYVFAAGNSKIHDADPNIVNTPAKILQSAIPNNVLIVGAVQSKTRNSSFSSWGAPVVNLWAPGTDWETLAPGGGTSTVSGTSFSSPTVAGVAALVLATHPALVGDPAGLQARLISTADSTVNVNIGCGRGESNRRLFIPTRFSHK